MDVTLKLQIGAVTTQVNVLDAIAPVDTTQTSETSLIDRNEIDNLPINGTCGSKTSISTGSPTLRCVS